MIVLAYVAPSLVVTGDSVTAPGYNIIVNDVLDHESRITTNATNILKGIQPYTTLIKNGLTGVTTGTMIYDTNLGLVQVWNGTVWTTVPNKRVGVKVNRTTNFTLGGADITWSNATWDTDPNGSMWTLATNPERIYIKTAGLYLVNLQGSWTGTATSTPYVTSWLVKSGSIYASSSNSGYQSTTAGYFSLSAQVDMAVNDYFKFQTTITGVTSPVLVGNTLYDNSTTSATITLLGV